MARLDHALWNQRLGLIASGLGLAVVKGPEEHKAYKYYTGIWAEPDQQDDPVGVGFHFTATCSDWGSDELEPEQCIQVRIQPLRVNQSGSSQWVNNIFRIAVDQVDMKTGKLQKQHGQAVTWLQTQREEFLNAFRTEQERAKNVANNVAASDRLKQQFATIEQVVHAEPAGSRESGVYLKFSRPLTESVAKQLCAVIQASLRTQEKAPTLGDGPADMGSQFLM